MFTLCLKQRKITLVYKLLLQCYKERKKGIYNHMMTFSPICNPLPDYHTTAQFYTFYKLMLLNLLIPKKNFFTITVQNIYIKKHSL